MTKKQKNQPNAIAFLEKIKRLAITGLFADDHLLEKLVLKGGNLLDLVYRIAPRASVDVDFSIDGDFDEPLDDLTKRIERALHSVFSDAGYVVFDVHVNSVPANISDDMRDFWGGYKVDFKVIETDRYQQFRQNIDDLRRNSLSVGKRGSTKFSIDISKHENCEAKQAVQLDGFTIFTYTPPDVCMRKVACNLPTNAGVHSHGQEPRNSESP